MPLEASEFLSRVWQALQNELDEPVQVACGVLNVQIETPSRDWTSLLTETLPRRDTSGPAQVEVKVISRAQLDQLPPFPLEVPQQASRGRFPQWCDQNFLALGSPSGLTLVDRSCQPARALVYYESATSVPTWDLCAPLRVPLGFILPRFGYHLVHAAALATPFGGCLLVGQGGSGKSSSALVSLSPDSRLELLGEDYLLVEQASVSAYPFYRSFKVDQWGLERMPWLREYPQLGDQDGKSCRLLPPPAHLSPCPLEVMVWPDRGEPSPVIPIPKSVALRKFAPSSLFQNPSASADDFRALISLARKLSSFGLGLGDSPSAPTVEQRILKLMETACPN